MDFNRVTRNIRNVRSGQPRRPLLADRRAELVRARRTNGGSRERRHALPGAAQPVQTDTGPNSASTRNEETINYEISKSTKTLVQDAGTVKKLSVAVVVDGTYTRAPTARAPMRRAAKRT